MWTESLAFIKCALAAASLFLQIRSRFCLMAASFRHCCWRE